MVPIVCLLPSFVPCPQLTVFGGQCLLLLLQLRLQLLDSHAHGNCHALSIVGLGVKSSNLLRPMRLLCSSLQPKQEQSQVKHKVQPPTSRAHEGAKATSARKHDPVAAVLPRQC